MVLGEPGALLSRAAVLGSPVAHSLSPALHQAAYAALGLEDWTYDRFEVAEAIRTAYVHDGSLVVRVDSNGCTSASDFELAVTDGEPAEVTLKRTKPDNCRALLAEGVELRWTYADLGLEPGAPVRVLNPLK